MATRKKNPAAETATPLDPTGPPVVTPPADFPDAASPNAALRGEPVRFFQWPSGERVMADSVADVAATRDALRRPAPAFVADLYAHDDRAHGALDAGEIPHPARVEVPGSPCGGFTPEPGAPKGLDALRDLYDTAEGFRFLDVATWPAGTNSAPRVAFEPPTARLCVPWDAVPFGVYRRVKDAGQVVYRCHLTGDYFALAPSAPVPCLAWDFRAEPGTPDAEGEPPSVASRPIFPGLVAAGPEAVRAAIWQAAWDDLHAASERANDALDGYLRALDLGDDLPALPWPSSAYVPGGSFTAFGRED